MKKKAKILTIYDPNPNYGNRLQNYAVQYVLNNLGLDVTTISVEKAKITIMEWIKYILQRMSCFHFPGNKVYWQTEFQKKVFFYAFNKKYIKTQYVKSINDIEKSDYYVIGSDQVWNPEWYRYCPIKADAFLLTFAKPEQKVCFSPSFGVDEIGDEWKTWFAKQLSTFPQIAVREQRGAEIVKSLTGKQSVVTIDPTLMLSQEEWNQLAKSPKRIDCKKNYILTYFLGGRSERVEKDLRRFEEMTGYTTYNLLDKSFPTLYRTDPSEFIYLISHAQLILTDSFHACVFSFIYKKPFLVYNRQGGKGMMSRINTLLNKFSLERKYVESGLVNELFECDYREGYITLELERKKLMDYLTNTMHL